MDGAVLRDEETAALVAGQLLALHVLDYQFCVRPTPPAPAPSPDKRPSGALCTAAHPFDAPVSIAVRALSTHIALCAVLSVSSEHLSALFLCRLLKSISLRF